MALESEILQQLKELNRNATKTNDVNSLLTDENVKDMEKFLQRFNDAIGAFTVTVQRRTTELENVNQQITKIFDSNKEDFGKYQEELQNVQRIRNLDDRAVAVDDLIEKIKLVNPELANLVSKTKSYSQEIADAEKDIKNIEKNRDAHGTMQRRIRKSHRSNIDNIFEKMGIEPLFSPENKSPMFELLDQLRKGNFHEDLFKEFLSFPATIMKNFVDPLNIGLNIIGQIKKQTVAMVMALDEASVGLMKATGDTERFQTTLKDSFSDLRYYNITLEDVSQSVQALATNVRGFSSASESDQKKITNYVAALGRLGVGFDNSAKAVSFFTDTLGESESEAIGSMSKLLGISKKTGESFNKVIADFNQSFADLAQYGKQANNVFKELFGTAKSLKIETNQILEISRQFETFDSAASSVGRLNAVLGGPFLNTLQMMNQNPAEKIQSLVAAFKSTGRTFSQLDRFTQQAVAASIGITDMSLAAKIFGGSLSDVARYTRDAHVKQEELNKTNARAATLAEKFKNIMMSLATAFEPILDLLHSVTSAFAWLADEINIGAIPVIWFATSVMFGFGKSILSVFSALGGKFLGALGKAGKLFSKLSVGADIAKAGMGGFAKAAGEIAPSLVTASASGATFATTLTAISSAAPKIAQAILYIGAAAAAVFTLFKVGEGIVSALFDTPQENLAEAIADIGDDGIGKMNAFANMWKTVSQYKLSDVSESSVSAITDILDSLDGISGSFSANISTGFLDSINKFMTTASAIEPTKVENIKQVTSNIVEMSQKLQDAKSGTNALDKIGQLLNTAFGNKESDLGKITIVVKVGDETLVNKTLGELNKRGDIYSLGVTTI